MGNKFCCNEERLSEEQSKPEDNYNNDINKDNNNNLNNANNEENNENNDNNLPTLQDNNTIDSENKNKRKKNFYNNNKYDSNELEDINNMKSSIFDNENENENDNKNLNEENIDSTANFKAANKKKYKSGNNSSENYGVKINIKKKKNDLNNSDKEFTPINKILKKNPNYKFKPLKLKDFNDNKENEFYLINNPKYIGLKNKNSNLVFIKNKFQNNCLTDNIELIGTKKEFLNNKEKDLTNRKKNNNDKDNENNNDFNIVYTNYSYSNRPSDSINPNINVTTRNHNLPFDEKETDKNYSTSSKKAKNNNNNNQIPSFINKDPIIQNIHTNNERLIEIYIKNQIRKIIKVLKDKTERQKEPKQLLNIDKIKNIINYNQINDEVFGDNNQLIKIDNRNDIKNNELNDISLTFDVLNTSKSQTIINKSKNFCIKFFSNGSIYIGEVKNDKLDGHGKFMNVLGDIILGFFKDNCFHGYNLIERTQNNSRFEGQFEKNKFNGYGIVMFSDGSSYFGQYKNNEKWGLGTYSWENGCQYQGEWKNGRPNGLGIFIDSKDKYYEGEWKNGMMNGIGLFKWGDGRKYFGGFNNDKRNGFGIYFWNNPLKIYLGFWINGLQNGIGKVLTSFKEKYYIWKDGKIIKKFSSKNDIALQLDKQEMNKMKKYQYFFKLNVDDLLTFILDL